MTQIDRLASITKMIAAGEKARAQFGPALKSARRRVGLSQKHAAEFLGVSQKHMNQLESQIARPSPELAERALKELGRLEDGSDHTRYAKRLERAGRPRL